MSLTKMIGSVTYPLCCMRTVLLLIPPLVCLPSNSCSDDNPSPLSSLHALQAFEPASYQAHLQAKLAALRDLVEANATEAAATQKGSYDGLSQKRVFRQGDPVWLSLPTAGKLVDGQSCEKPRHHGSYNR